MQTGDASSPEGALGKGIGHDAQMFQPEIATPSRGEREHRQSDAGLQAAAPRPTEQTQTPRQHHPTHTEVHRRELLAATIYVHNATKMKTELEYAMHHTRKNIIDQSKYQQRHAHFTSKQPRNGSSALVKASDTFDNAEMCAA